MPFNDPSSEATNQLQELLSALMGTEFSGMLTTVISDAITQSSSKMPGGGTMATGDNALFGPVNVGRNVASSFNNIALNSMMQDTKASATKARVEYREHMASMLGQPGDGGYLTRKASDFVFEASKVRELETGLATAGRFAGVGSLLGLSEGSRETQAAINKSFGTYSNTIMQSFLDNESKFGGMDGQQVGQVVRELSQSGSIDRGLMQDLASKNKEVAASAKQTLTNQVQEASQTVAAMTMGTGLSAGAALNKFNQTVGGSFLGIFGDNGGKRLMQDMASISGMSGRSPQFMSSLITTAEGANRAAGGESGAGINIAMQAVEAESLQRFASKGYQMTGRSQSLISTPGFIKGEVQRNTAAAQSREAKMGAGAVALLRSQGKDKEADDLAERLASGDVEASDLVGELNKIKGIKDVDETTLVAASQTQGGRIELKKGTGSAAGKRANAKNIAEIRKFEASALLDDTDLSAEDKEEITNRMDKGMGFEQAANAAIKEGKIKGSTKLTTAIGLGAESDKALAESEGFENVEALNKSQLGTLDKEANKLMKEKKAQNARLQDLYGEVGKQGGLKGLKNFTRLVGSGESKATIEEFTQQLTGNTDLKADQIAAAGGMASDLAAVLDDPSKLPANVKKDLAKGATLFSDAFFGKEGADAQKRAIKVAEEAKEATKGMSKADRQEHMAREAAYFGNYLHQDRATNEKTIDKLAEAKGDSAAFKGDAFKKRGVKDNPNTPDDESIDKKAVTAFQEEAQELSRKFKTDERNMDKDTSNDVSMAKIKEEHFKDREGAREAFDKKLQSATTSKGGVRTEASGEGGDFSGLEEILNEILKAIQQFRNPSGA